LFLDPRTERQTIVIGGLREWENPCLTIEEFKEKAAITAGALGADAVQIQNEGDPARLGASTPSRSFVASLLLIPRARLGLEGESKRWQRNDLVIRGFAKESLASGAGLKVGDRIVALNGVDVLQEKRCAQAWLSWAVGESVVVTFVRDGKEMSLQAKTIAN